MKKVLIANPFGLGDAIFSMFLAEAIRLQSPDTIIDFLGNERTHDLLKMNRSIRKIHTLDRDRLRRLWTGNPAGFWKASGTLLSGVHREKYDALFDLSLGREFSFHALWMGIVRRYGLDFKKRGFFLSHKIPIAGYEGRHAVLHQMDLLPLAGFSIPELSGRLPLDIPPYAREAARLRLEEAHLRPGDYVALAPGGGRSWGENAVYKQWSPDRFAEIIRRLAAQGTGAILIGDESERDLLSGVQAASGVRAPVLAGLPIGEACALLVQSRGLLANDGGLAHLASALGVRVAAIFGPVDEQVYGPFIPPAGSEILAEPVHCRPCYNRFVFPPCAHARACLEQLPVERVWSAVSKMV